jgi:hypothetical protein
MSLLSFYHDIPVITDFKSVADKSKYYDVPEDWTVIITDISGSTKAIEQGRYREVNKIGAATIAAAQNALNEEFPFVFGGDGATLLIPNDLVAKVKDALLGVQSLSIDNYQLTLRVGMVKLREVYDEGHTLKIAKHELAAGKCIAMFQGGALQSAEEKIKGQPEKYNVTLTEKTEANLDGLSCRWNPIPNKNGTVLTLLVLAKDNDQAIYEEVLHGIEHILGAPLDHFNPVNIEKASYRSIVKNLKSLRKNHSSVWNFSFIKSFVEIFLAGLLFQFGLGPFFSSILNYENSMKTHSDYRKFDEILRMVIDCSIEQKDQIRHFFHEQKNKGKIYFGMHSSANSLMTCFVNSVNDGDHIHFIDGDDGGYAMAAKELKAQLKFACVA